MNQILVITDDLNDTVLINFAYRYASRTDQDVTVASEQHVKSPLLKRELVLTGGVSHTRGQESSMSYDGEDTQLLLPRLSTINTSGFTNQKLIDLVNQHGISMIIAKINNSQFDLQWVLNNINCPLMVLPENTIPATINRVTYLTDLRYCQQPILANLAKYKSSGLLIAHICESGLPDLEQAYGNQLFGDAMGRFSNHGKWYYSHIYERDFRKITDTLINTMRTDLMVCSNRKHHFNRLLVNGLTKRLPKYLSVPLLIYPY